MLFNSQIFLFAFLPVTLMGWWTLRAPRLRLAWLCALSYGFYAYWDWRFLPLMLSTTLVDYFAARAIAAGRTPGRRTAWLALSLVFNLGLIGFFKYAGFLVRSLDALAALAGRPGLLPAV